MLIISIYLFTIIRVIVTAYLFNWRINADDSNLKFAKIVRIKVLVTINLFRNLLIIHEHVLISGEIILVFN